MSDSQWPNGYDYFAGPVTPHSPVPATPQPVTPAAPGSPWAPPPNGVGLDSREFAMLEDARQDSLSRMEAPSYYPVGGKLGFRDSLSAGWELCGTTWRVVASHPAVLVVTGVALVLSVAAALAYPVAFGGVHALLAGGKFAAAAKLFPLMFTVSVFGTVASAVVVDVGSDALSGTTPSVMKSWAKVLGLLPALVGFALMFTAERTLTGLMRGKRRWSPGTIAANAIDYAWDFATFLAIPVIVFEPGVGAWQAVKRSATLVRSRWGAQLTATNLIALAIIIAALPLMVLAGMVGSAVSSTVAFSLVIVVFLTALCLSATLQGVLSAAMYRFATTGLVAPGFREAEMWKAFSRRTK